MRTFDIQAIEITAPRETVFGFVSDPRNLPRWGVHPDRHDFADHGNSFENVKRTIRGVESARRALEVHRSSVPRRSNVDFARRVVSALDGPAD